MIFVKSSHPITRQILLHVNVVVCDVLVMFVVLQVHVNKSNFIWLNKVEILKLIKLEFEIQKLSSSITQ